MFDVMISYASEDRALARLLVSRLSAIGLNVWWDQLIAPGRIYREEIEQKLESCRKVIVVWSPNSIASTFVRDEAQRALNLRKLVPCIVSGVTPPIGFGDVNAAIIDMQELQSDETLPWIKRLARELRESTDGCPIDAAIQGALPIEIQRACRAKAQELRAILIQLQNLAGNSIFQHFEEEIDNIFERLLAPEFEIGFIGDFSVGKSSLLNAIIADTKSGPILAVGADPTSFVPTAVRWGDEICCFIEFSDGSREPCRLDEIESFKLDNQEAIRRLANARRVVIEGVLPLRFKGITLTDTRGAKDSAKGTELTTKVAQRFDAVVAVCMADMSTGFHDHEIEFVTSITPRDALRFWVVNDFGADWSSKRTRAFLWNRIVRDVESGPPYAEKPLSEGRIYILNAKDADSGRRAADRGRIERSGIVQFETDLARYVVEAGWQGKAQPWLSRLVAILRKMSDAIEIEAQGNIFEYEQKSGDRLSTVAQLNDHLKDIDQIKAVIAERRRLALSVLKKRFSDTIFSVVQLIANRLRETQLESLDSSFKRVKSLAASQDVQKEIVGIFAVELRRHLEAWATESDDPDSVLMRLAPFIDDMIEQTAQTCVRVSFALDRMSIQTESQVEAQIFDTELQRWRELLATSLLDSAWHAGGRVDLSKEGMFAVASAPILIALGQQLSVIIGTSLVAIGGSTSMLGTLGIGSLAAKLGTTMAAGGPAGVVIGVAVAALVVAQTADGVEGKVKQQAQSAFMAESNRIMEQLWPRVAETIDEALKSLGGRLGRELEMLEARARQRIEALDDANHASRQEYEQRRDSRLKDKKKLDIIVASQLKL